MANNTAERLRRLMLLLEIPNVQLAKALNIDPSLVSKWLTNGFGKRREEEHALRIGHYIASRQWGRDAGMQLSACLSLQAGEAITPERIASFLLPNRYPDTEDSPVMLSRFREAVGTGSIGSLPENDSHIRCEIPEIASLIRQELSNTVHGSTIDVFFSSESITCATDPEILRVILACSEELDLKWRILIQSANNTAMSGKLIGTFMPLLVRGRLQLNILQGTPQTFTASMNLLIPNSGAILITEVIQKRNSVIAVTVRDWHTVENLHENFESTLRYSRPLMTAYDDQYIHNVIELFAEEYCTPGSLDVVKSGMNPMYFSPEEYGRILKKLGMKDNEYDWRIEKFCQLDGALGIMMQGSRSREVLSLSMLERIVETGKCCMPGMYFMTSGICYMDREDIAALLEDYIRYLKEYPDFHMILLADDTLFSPNSCWHIKSNKHITIHTWDIDDPVLVVSDRMMMIDEFQRYFDVLWNKATAGTTDRDTIRELERLRDICLSGTD